MSIENWKAIWEKRSAALEQIDRSDLAAVCMELCRINGYDIVEGGIEFESVLEDHERIKKRFCLQGGDSYFEVACGCGAKLYLFWHDGIKIGGLDYSEKLISILQDVIPREELLELVCAEAKDLPTEMQYDVVLTTSCSHYFPDLAYAGQVLEKIYQKSRRGFGFTDVHDLAKKEEFFAYRYENTEDYKKRYEGLDKLFYPKSFFEDFAKKHGLKVEFAPGELKGYWNNPFIYHVYFHK